MEKSINLQPDFAPAGELLYILYYSNDLHAQAINLLEKVKNYNPICMYDFFYLGLEKIALQKHDDAIDSFQNAIRIFYGTKNFSKPLKADWPELNKNLLERIFSVLPKKIFNNTVGDLHPISSGAIMWVHLCHCYTQQGNYEAAYNCIHKGLDDYLHYFSISESQLEEEQPIEITGFYTALCSSINELSNSLQFKETKLNLILKHLSNYKVKSKEKQRVFTDVLCLVWNMCKTSFYISMFKEVIAESEIGIRIALTLALEDSSSSYMKYCESFLTFIMQSGYHLLLQLQKSGISSILQYTEKYVKIMCQLEELDIIKQLKENIGYLSFSLEILLLHYKNSGKLLEKIASYSENVARIGIAIPQYNHFLTTAIIANKEIHNAKKDKKYLETADSLAKHLISNYPSNAEYWILLSSLPNNNPIRRERLLLHAISLDPIVIN